MDTNNISPMHQGGPAPNNSRQERVAETLPRPDEVFLPLIPAWNCSLLALLGMWD